MIKIKKNSALIFLCFYCSMIQAQEPWNSDHKEIIKTIENFSESTSVNGKGANAYASFLSEDFTRWTIGSDVINNKVMWVEGIRDWFDEGWRVSDRSQQFIEINIANGLGHVRRIVTETYLGPDGSTSSSKAALVETWKKENEQWLLYRTNVQPIKAE
ncbi:DUF4440 domain-containing protein [Hyphobacterium sp. CCMP332]|nr:DUF4440 domain-containing protein [Hyphobacterium sp. CCMP332]